VTRFAVGLVALALSTACGSTVAITGTAQVPGQVPGDQLGLDGGAGTTGATLPDGTSGSPRPQSPGTPMAPTTTDGPGSSGPAVVVPPSRAAATGPIPVGFIVQANGAEVAKSLGADNLQNGNERPMVEALVADANARGGINGRPLKPVYFAFDPQTQGDFATIQQQACATFTEDNRVVAVLMGWHAFADHQLEDCLQRRGVVAVNSAGILTGGEQTLSRLPDVVAPPGVALGRQARAYIASIGRQGFFGSGVKVGVIALDTPEYKVAVERELLPALRRQGVSAQPDLVYYPALQSTADVSRQSAAMSSAVLRFRGNGVSRVVFLQQGINGPYMFMQAAESQGYRPRYALSSTDGPSALAPLASPNQLRGTVGMGWVPVLDVPADKDTSPAPRRKACLDLLRKKTAETFTTRTVEYVGLAFCDSLWFFELAAGRASSVDLAGVRTAVAGLGTTYESPLVLRSRFGPGMRDGAAVSRDLRYVDSCSCFAYSGGLHPIT